MTEVATHEALMRRALGLARGALEARELPIAAVLASGDKVLAEAHNLVAGERDLLAHAEFRVLFQGKEVLRTLKLADRQQLALYATLEPCMMCFGALMNFNIGKLFYALESPGDGVMPIVEKWEKKSEQLQFYKAPAASAGLLREESAALFCEFSERFPDSRFANWTRQLGRVVGF